MNGARNPIPFTCEVLPEGYALSWSGFASDEADAAAQAAARWNMKNVPVRVRALGSRSKGRLHQVGA